MEGLNEKVVEYLNNGVTGVVKESILILRDINIDGFNDQGCNGYVFFGEHKVFIRRVAIKYYYFGEDSHEEVMLLKNIKHDNIINVWDASIVGDGWAYFITDEISHGNIDDCLRENKLTIHDSLHITMGILSGLSELHKSENQLLEWAVPGTRIV